ncbi:MAG TPA: ferredoxin reductase [Kofleriaceae bacterium]
MLGLQTHFAETAWRRWFLDRHVEFWRNELGIPARMQARIVEVIVETADTRTFVLRPGRRWPGHRAGQYIPVDVEIDGVRTRRCYSISSGASARGAQRISITIKRVPGGRVSTWFHDHAQPGDTIDIGPPAGDFVVEESGDELVTQAPRRLLFVAGGSGITPVMAIVRDLETSDMSHDVVLVHASRGDGDAIFGRELAALATTEAGLRLVAHRDSVHGRLDAATLVRLVPDLARREVFVCGPPGLLDLVTEVAAASGVPVHHERFVASHRPPTNDNAAPVTIRLRQRNVVVAGTGPLLGELEHAGERPPHGCRMGICNTCRCHKHTGTVEDLLTGAVSSEPDQEIRLCVSIARSDLELAL